MAQAKKAKDKQVPVAEQPVAEQPVAEQPVAEQPVAEQPVAEQPVAVETGPEQVAIMVPMDRKVTPMGVLRQAARQAAKPAPTPRRPSVRVVGGMTIRSN